ncbi:MAG: radical SAM protein [Nitrospirae bacterium]|nr:MAG: radical SAM protein [Nitrospirota bacterium]
MSKKLLDKIDRLLSKETGTIYKDPGGKVSVCLVYPNTYRIGMSNLGFQGIYGLLNSRSDVVCERAFLPDDDDLSIHRRSGAKIFSLESKRRLTDFDIVAFSLSFENDYPNIVRILDLSGIPILSSGRSGRYPLLIAGGVCCFFNPEPVAEIFDVIFTGEAEGTLSWFMDAVQSSDDIKASAANIEGVYVPSFYSVEYKQDGTIGKRVCLNNAPEKIKVTHVRDFSIRTAITTPESEFSGMRLIEVMRGCPWSCRFCLVGHIYNPPRKKDFGVLKAEIESCGERNSVGLIGPSLSDYPSIKEALAVPGVSFSITSLRAGAASGELIALLKGNRSVSIAPEAGTERMRRVVNKRITEDDILSAAEMIFATGIETLRLYFMVGLPTETSDDIEGIIKLVKKIRGCSARGNIVLSVSPFVPKPFTPFQWHPMEDTGPVKSKISRIKKSLVNVKGVKVFHDVPKHARMQGLFSRGDRRLVRVLQAMAETDDYAAACRSAAIDVDFYVSRPRSFEEHLPWDFIEAGTDKKRLWQEYDEALSLQTEVVG